MSKRELSSTLKSLKFMQRASQREEKTSNKEVEQVDVKLAGDFPSTSSLKRCVVIVEGDTLPEAPRGRMSFLSFNPSIDKLYGEESDPSQNESFAANSTKQSEPASSRENGSPSKNLDKLEVDTLSSGSNGDLKRKQADITMQPSYANKSKKGSKSSSPGSSHSSQKHHKQEKLDWNVLRPPKYPSKTK